MISEELETVARPQKAARAALPPLRAALKLPRGDLRRAEILLLDRSKFPNCYAAFSMDDKGAPASPSRIPKQSDLGEAPGALLRLAGEQAAEDAMEPGASSRLLAKALPPVYFPFPFLW